MESVYRVLAREKKYDSKEWYISAKTGFCLKLIFSVSCDAALAYFMMHLALKQMHKFLIT